MPEIFIPFGSKAAWDAWAGRNWSALSGQGAMIAEEVARSGLVEPLTGIRRRPAEVTVNIGNLGESLSASGMNSRKRALLLTLDVALKALIPSWRPGFVIHAPEAALRVARAVAEKYPDNLRLEGAGAGRAPDLRAIGLPDASVDALVVADALDAVEDREAAWTEMRRIVRPGGIIVASFRFNPSRHDPQAPGPAGWEILDSFRAAGWADASMVLVASARHGIAASAAPGIHIFAATRDPQEGGGRSWLDAARCGRRPLPEKACLLVALPRSGTTLLTAMFAVHSRFDAVFEPWNAKALAGPEDADLPRLLEKLDLCRTEGRFLFVKETAADTRYIDYMSRLHDGMGLPLDRTVLMLCRRPAHVFLSEVERRNEWWGDEVPLDQRQFDLWCGKSRTALRKMIALLGRAGGSVLCYERLAEDPAGMLARLAALIGFEAEPRQLEFERHLDRRKVRGDLNVARNPERISVESIRRRAENEALVGNFARQSAHGGWFADFTAFHRLVQEKGLCPLAAIPEELLDRLAG